MVADYTKAVPIVCEDCLGADVPAKKEATKLVRVRGAYVRRLCSGCASGYEAAFNKGDVEVVGFPDPGEFSVPALPELGSD